MDASFLEKEIHETSRARGESQRSSYETKIFSDPKFFQIQNFFGPKIFLDKKFLLNPRFIGPKI